MSDKTIKLASGSVIRRENIGKYDEEWIAENKTNAILSVTLDLTNCTNVLVEGHEGQQEATESVGPKKTKTLFVIRKTPPFSFKIGYAVNEDSSSLTTQPSSSMASKLSGDDKLGALTEQLLKLPFEVLDEKSLENEIRKLGYDHFIDPSFPPDDTSIYDASTEEKYPLDKRPVWKRPHEFMNNPKLFEQDVDPNDINQGALGNCWFLASIAALAESPALVKRLFIAQKYNKFGIYKLRICKNGEWVVVTIDDFIPCYRNGGPMFCTATGDELWVILLEKAYAKLHGNYWQLRAGYVSHGMMDLSGCPTQKYNFPSERNDYYSIRDYAEDFWNTITDADKQGFIMWAGTPGVDVWTEGGGPNEEFGIVPGHAYSIIGAKQYKNIRLVKVRNPWGDFEWGGKWSDKDTVSWTKEMINAFKPEFDTKDGTFWISYEEFFKYFDSVSIWQIKNWKEIRLKGKFIKVQEEEKDNEWVISQFYYTFTLKSPTYMIISLHQEDERHLGWDKRPYVDLSYSILKREKDGTLSIAGFADSITDRDLEQGFNLDAGNYIVVPRTTGALMTKHADADNTPVPIRLYSGGKKFFNPKVYSTLRDIFRKIDLQFDGILTARELNLFGKIVNEPYFKSITQKSFTSKEFRNISWTEDGGKSFVRWFLIYSH